MRGDRSDFSNPELSLLTSLSGRIAEGLRRCALVEQAATAPPPGPGLVLLSISDRLVIDHATEAAQRWLADIDDGTAEGIPHSIAACAHQALARTEGAGEFRSRIRTRAGHWMTLHAERLGPSTVSVILIPSHPAEVATLLADVYRLPHASARSSRSPSVDTPQPRSRRHCGCPGLPVASREKTTISVGHRGRQLVKPV